MINNADRIRELVMSGSCRDFNLVSIDREAVYQLIDWFNQNYHSISPYDERGIEISPDHLKQKIENLTPRESIHFSGESHLIIENIKVFLRIEENHSVFTEITFSPRSPDMDELEASSLIDILHTWQKILNSKIGYLRYENLSYKFGKINQSGLMYVPKPPRQ